MSSVPDPSPPRLYLDNAATSFPKPRATLEAMQRYFAELGASPGRGGYAESLEAGRLMTECRAAILKLLKSPAAPEHIAFGLNCTDALNLAIHGLLDHAPNSHAICTDLDHNSILRPLNTLADQNHTDLTRVPVDPITGLVDPDDLRQSIRPNTRLIAITHASNVSGTVQPIREIGQIAREHNIPFLVDAAQSAGHVPINVEADHIDLLAAPGHKFLMGPLGTGFLFIRPGIEKILRSHRQGGTGSVSEHDRQPDFLPDKYEPGSHNAPGVIGLLAGVNWVLTQTVEKLHAHDQSLSQTFLETIAPADSLTLHGPQSLAQRIGVFSVRIESLAPHELSSILESHFGLLTRSGLHCAPHAHRTLGTAATGGTTRLSFGPFLTHENVQYAANALVEVATSIVTK